MPDTTLVPLPRSLTWTGQDLVTADPDRALTTGIDPDLAAEAYRLEVDADGARLSAGSENGVLLGRSTFRQLLDGARREGDGRTVVPGVVIDDEPSYSWRGLMVDCSRHVTPLAHLRTLVDALALHRMNRLHLHLTDDQGWRIEIDGWPRLVEVGARRARTLVNHHSAVRDGDEEPVWDEQPYAGHYTQQELRDLVAYAAQRGVVVVPEIDLPGHMQAAVAAYPELGNLDEPVGVREVWGISDHVLAPTETAFRFVDDVLDQVMDIFPGPWIHIGGDECPTVEWEQSEQAQRFMAEHGLTDERQIQHVFLERAHDRIRAAGRTMIGWDEILEADAPADAVTMLWRRDADVPLAERHGVTCVYANSGTLYLDHLQGPQASEPLGIGGLTTLADVYATQELPQPPTPRQRELLLGVQAQLWREYIRTEEHLDYMIFPRLCAVSEVAWGVRTDMTDFVGRLRGGHLARLDALEIGYRPLDEPG